MLKGRANMYVTDVVPLDAANPANFWNTFTKGPSTEMMRTLAFCIGTCLAGLGQVLLNCAL